MARTSKKVVKTYEVVAKNAAHVGMTEEMVKYLIEHGLKENDNIAFHNPLLIQCVKELKPEEFRVVEIQDNKYRVIDLLNDSFIITPTDIKSIQKTWVEIPEENEDK